jgi:NTP pyrophosphatase (non-canonical NTP hydrolase)
MSRQATSLSGFKARGDDVELGIYQAATMSTDQRRDKNLADVAVHLLGLLGEAGSVAEQYKKKLRDGDAHRAWKARMREELGDILWYVAALANDFELDLDEIADANLEKTRNRWLLRGADRFDAAYPENEQLPRRGVYEFIADQDGAQDEDARSKVRVRFGDLWFGDQLTDASRVKDGYRFHDVFHLAYAVVLGWSPVSRALLGRKRRSDPAVDEAEDGGRAIVIEEAVSVLVFAYAGNHDYLEGVNRLDQHLLDTIQSLVCGTEVGVRSAADWELAILTGFKMWRALLEHGGGSINFDSDARTMSFDAPS